MGIFSYFRFDLFSIFIGKATGFVREDWCGTNQNEGKKKSCGFKGCVRRLRTIDVVFADINEKLKLFAALGLAPSLAPRLPRLKSLRLFN